MVPKVSLLACLALIAGLAISVPIPDDPKDVTLKLHFSGKEQSNGNTGLEPTGEQNQPWKQPESPKYVRTPQS